MREAKCWFQGPKRRYVGSINIIMAEEEQLFAVDREEDNLSALQKPHKKVV